MVQQAIQPEQMALLVNALCSDAVRGVDQEPAQQQLLAVIFNTITLAGQYSVNNDNLFVSPYLVVF